MTVTHADEMREALARGFRERLDALPSRMLDSLRPNQAEQLGGRVVGAALAPKIWADAVAARFETAQLVEMLGITRQALAKRVVSGTLLGLPGKGTTFYPIWQFDLSAEPVRVRRSVAAAFAAWVEEMGSLDPYAVASWAQTRQPELHDLTPVEYLGKGGGDDGEELLVFSARVTASRLAQ